jgi:hypothetical protein
MAPLFQMPSSLEGGSRSLRALAKPALLVAGALLLLGGASSPAFAERCTTNQNGQTICCDNSGNCWSK